MISQMKMKESKKAKMYCFMNKLVVISWLRLKFSVIVITCYVLKIY